MPFRGDPIGHVRLVQFIELHGIAIYPVDRNEQIIHNRFFVVCIRMTDCAQRIQPNQSKVVQLHDLVRNICHLHTLGTFQSFVGNDVNDVFQTEWSMMQLDSESIPNGQIRMYTTTLHTTFTFQKVDQFLILEGITNHLLHSDNPFHVFLLVFEQTKIVKILGGINGYFDLFLLGFFTHRYIRWFRTYMWNSHR